MSRKLVKSDQRELEELPMFRDPEPGNAEMQTEEAALTDEAATSAGDLNAALESLDEPAAPPPPTPTPRRSRRASSAPRAIGSSHGVWIGLGVGATLVGIALAVVAGMRLPAAAPAFEALGLAGVTPAVLVILGLLCWGIGLVLQRQVQNLQEAGRLENTLGDLLTLTDAVDLATRQLQEADAARAATPTTSSDDLGQVLFALQRTDEKIVNLTKATKTFGKPLVEITAQLADAAAQVVQSQAHIQALKVTAENGLGRVEETLRKQSDGRVADEARADGLRRAFEELRVAVQARIEAQTRELQMALDATKTELGKQVANAAPATGALEKRVDALQSSLQSSLEDQLTAQAKTLRDSLDGVSRELAAKVGELAKAPRDSGVNLAPIQSAINDLRRDFANLSHGLANAPRVTSAPTVAVGPLSDPPPAPPPAPAPAPAAKIAGEDPPPNGLAQSIAGQHTPKNANVMGAIAKLKKLRG
jgi:hypothetical protein